ncbi:hypothetical protein GN156_05035 [bacterium LRH843]|nr:hypothetical protein [bacterium LRH843]
MARESKFKERQVVEDVINLYESGLSCTDIGQQYSVSKVTIWRVLKNDGIELRKPKGKKSEFSNEYIYEMHLSGSTLSEIAEKTGIKERAVMNRLKNMGVKFPRGGSRKYAVKDVIFSSWSYEMAYILGLIFADGCMAQTRHSFSISQKEKEILIKIARLLGMPEKSIKMRNGSYHLSIHSVEMCKMLFWHGVTPNKSSTVEFPNVPTRYMGAFLRGIIDGDGWVDRKGYRVVVYTGSEKFSKGLNQAFLQLNLNSRIRKDKRGLYCITVSRKQNVRKLKEIIYTKSGDLYLKRKFLRFDSA